MKILKVKRLFDLIYINGDFQYSLLLTEYIKMKHLLFLLLIFLVQPMFCQVLTNEQKDFCISTFNKYLNVKEELIKERTEVLKSLNSSEEDIDWFKDNIIRMDSVMKVSIELVKNNECSNLANLLEKERYNIYAHPHNDSYLCYDFHSVMALIYSNTIKGDREYFMKLADLGEYSKIMIEAVQANWEKPHPLYLQVLNELKQIYETLENQSKVNEMLLLILKVERDS